MKVEPSNKDTYLNKDVSFLKQAKYYLTSKNFKDCIKEIEKLEFKDEHLNIFVNKIKIYSELKNTLNLLT